MNAGSELSGGQRQRVAIAHAQSLRMPPCFYFFDEATSSLDSESESADSGRRSAACEKDAPHSSSRIACRRFAAPIRSWCWKAGEIVERGTHPQLIALNGRYRQLHDKQYKLETDRFINPGEDFAPEPEKPAAPRMPRVGSELCRPTATEVR